MKSKQYYIDKIIATLERMIKVGASSALASIGTTATMGGVDWKLVGSTTLLAMLVSVLTSIVGGGSIAGTPEVNKMNYVETIIEDETEE